MLRFFQPEKTNDNHYTLLINDLHQTAQDHSEPLMKNTQQVYAGYTYGRDNLVETCQDSDSSRGFLV